MDIDDGIDMDWIRSLTGKDRAEDVELKSTGSLPWPRIEGSNVTYLDRRPGIKPRKKDPAMEGGGPASGRGHSRLPPCPAPSRRVICPPSLEGGTDIDDGIDMDWIRSLTGKDRAEDVELKPIGHLPWPRIEGSNVTYLDRRPGYPMPKGGD